MTAEGKIAQMLVTPSVLSVLAGEIDPDAERPSSRCNNKHNEEASLSRDDAPRAYQVRKIRMGSL